MNGRGKVDGHLLSDSEGDGPALLDQSRWNLDYGTAALQAFADDPDSFVVEPANLSEAKRLLLHSVPDLRGKRLLDFGCGQGELSVAAALMGASVVGIDIGEDLVELSRRVAALNGVEIEFVVGSIHELPFEDNDFDVVMGSEILHHLPEEATATALYEAHRVLAVGGRACFMEPLENSKVFDALQSLVPVGKPGDSQYRPSIVQRRKWKVFQEALDERQLTDRELETVAARYSSMSRSYYGWLSRLTRVIPAPKAARIFAQLDGYLTHDRSPVKRFSRQVLVHLVK